MVIIVLSSQICVLKECNMVANQMKSLVKAAARSLPQKRRLLRFGANLHPALKSSFSLRICSFLSSQIGEPIEVETNLGFSNRKYIFSSHHVMPSFGKPSLYAGERAALLMTRFLSNYADAFVDVGSHLGYFSYYVRHYLPEEKPIYLFEPDNDLFAVILKNIEKAKLKNIHPSSNALSDKDGIITFYKNIYHPDCNSITSTYSEVHKVVEVSINSTRFDTFIEENNLHNLCVKVDIENAEEQFVLGADSCIARISYLVIEVLSRGHKKGFVDMMIDKYSLHAYYINDFSLEHYKDQNFRYQAPQYNWLFCRENPSQLRMLLQDTPFTISEPQR